MAAKTVIYDFGANTGSNVPYYLEKADLVVAIEANPALCRSMEEQFATEVAAGRLAIENVVVVAERGPTKTPFFVHRTSHVLSQLPRPPARLAANFTEVVLPARHVLDIVAQYGSPHYIKIDIEHSDAAILRALLTHGVRPPYISAEAHDADIFCLLVALGGYGAFKLVEGNSVQNAFATHEITTPSGRKIHSFKRHSAGPFGNDLPGPWLGKNTFFQLLGRAGLGWRDIHASLVDQLEPPPVPLQTATASRPAAGDSPQGTAPRHAMLQGEFLVLADPLLFMTASGQPIVSSATDRLAYRRTEEMIRRDVLAARSLPQTVHDEPSVILSCRWDFNFYHFLYDALGKLAVAELHGIMPANHAVYLNTPHAWQRDALRLLGVTPQPLPGGVVHHFRRGVIPSYPSDSFGPTVESVGFLRRFRPPEADQAAACKLFVSRTADITNGRILENEMEIYERNFRPRGYVIIDPGKLPFVEQCKLFARATHVAGSHGAALALLCLGRLPFSLIELHSPYYHCDYFRQIVNVLGGSYVAFNGRPDFFRAPHWTANFTLDPAAIAVWLESLPPGMT